MMPSRLCKMYRWSLSIFNEFNCVVREETLPIEQNYYILLINLTNAAKGCIWPLSGDRSRNRQYHNTPDFTAVVL